MQTKTLTRQHTRVGVVRRAPTATKRLLVRCLLLVLAIAPLQAITFPLGASAAPVTLFSDSNFSGNFSSWNSHGAEWSVSGNRARVTMPCGFLGLDCQAVNNSSLTKAISTAGYVNVGVSFKYQIIDQHLEAGDHFVAEWSTDGSTWNTLFDLFSTGNSALTTQSYSLPAGANNAAGFQLRFRANFAVDSNFTGSAGDQVRLDDVVITAETAPTENTLPLCTDSNDNDGDELVDLADPDCAPFDIDGDGVVNDDDNCPSVANPDQVDVDTDNIGDACDNEIDSDEDGIVDGIDNCVQIPNPDQADIDNDGAGDVCDPAQCANSVVESGETCDDGNTNDGDGCSEVCAVETGFSCEGGPSVCAAICGDGLILGGEACDDGNTTNADGCSASCDIEEGFSCEGEPSVCTLDAVCGNSVIEGDEVCDDGNITNEDGCSASCTVEEGFTCEGEPSVCTPVTPACTPEELIINGSFESPVVDTEAGWNLYASATFDGWRAGWMESVPATSGETSRPENPFIELQRLVSGWTAADGQQYSELDTDWNGPVGPNGFPASTQLYQDIPTIPGETYTVSFSFSARPGVNADNNKMRFDWNNTFVGAFERDGSSSENTVWEPQVYTELVATASTTRVSFSDTGTPNSLGMLIDKVSVLGCRPDNEPVVECGNGIIESEEACDDSNTTNGDGCSETCNVEEGYTCEGEPSVCVEDETPTPPTPPSGGGGGGSGGIGGGGIGLNPPVTPNSSTPAPQVLGVEFGEETAAAAQSELPASCSPYITTFMRFGRRNNTEEVKKLQSFLNQNLGTTLGVSGVFNTQTFNAVKQFQLKYADEILAPWLAYGLPNKNTATGYVYKTTRRWVNMLQCPALNLPVPQLP